MPNMTADQVRLAVESERFDPVKDFSVVCRAELMEVSEGVRSRKRPGYEASSIKYSRENLEKGSASENDNNDRPIAHEGSG